MKKLIALGLLLLATCSGCTFSRDGSQTIGFNPFNIGSDDAAIYPEHSREEFRSHQRSSRDAYGIRDSEPWDMR